MTVSREQFRQFSPIQRYMHVQHAVHIITYVRPMDKCGVPLLILLLSTSGFIDRTSSPSTPPDAQHTQSVPGPSTQT